MHIIRCLCIVCLLLAIYYCSKQRGITIHFTEKSKQQDTSVLQSRIHFIIQEMTEHMKDIPDLPIVVYHCDPSLQSGHSNNPKLSNYEYFDDLSYYKQYIQKHKTTEDKRHWNMTYGAGGTHSIPYTTICDASLLCKLTNQKPESVFVHEIAHTLWNTSIKQSYAKPFQRYYQEYKSQLKDKCPEVYACQSLEEFFAVLSEVWFGTTRRTDTTKLIETPTNIQERFPDLYSSLHKIYGPPKQLFHQVCN